MQSFEKLDVRTFSTTQQMGDEAAKYAANVIQSAVSDRNIARIILATGASQFSFLDSLKSMRDIPWRKVTVFHLDEYLDMSDQHPASFRRYLRERILDKVQPHQSHFLGGDVVDIQEELNRYENLLKEKDIDLACIGIGENGHIAFNDPPVADFNDPQWVKKVELDKACREQQFGEGWFTDFDVVPTHALTLTIPAIMNSKAISCVVPDARKITAVKNTLYGPVSESCPASILRTHDNAVLWLDDKSAAAVKS